MVPVGTGCCTNGLALIYKYSRVLGILGCRGCFYSAFYLWACCYHVLLCRAMGQGMERLVDEMRISSKAETVGVIETVGEEGLVDEVGPGDEG